MKNARATAVSIVSAAGIVATGWTVGMLQEPANSTPRTIGGDEPITGRTVGGDATAAPPTPDASSTPPTETPSPSASAAGASATPTPSAQGKAKPGSAATTPADAPKPAVAPANAASQPKPQAPAPTKPAQAPAAPATQPANQPAPAAQKPTSRYADGTYRGTSGHRFGNIIVTAKISGDRITSVTATDTAGDSRSQSIDDRALPILRQQVLSAQSPNISGVSGATLTSNAYSEALQQIFDQASN